MTTLLKRLSFPIAENLHWIPHAAKALLQKERSRLEDEAQAIIHGLIGKDSSKFAQERRQAIERDANQFYQEFHSGETINAETVSKVLAGLEERLKGCRKWGLLTQSQLRERWLYSTGRISSRFQLGPGEDIAGGSCGVFS